MNEADVKNLAKAFSEKLGKRVAFQSSTEPALLAGLKVTVNGVTYDGTLRSQIQKLRDYFVAGLPGAHI
jgi:F0F1-type ATP synthase delta subunit